MKELSLKLELSKYECVISCLSEFLVFIRTKPAVVPCFRRKNVVFMHHYSAS
jgi:hypothetical protein